jgi:membrane protein
VRGIAGAGSGALGLLGLFGMAWSGSNMFGVIRRSLNIAYDVELRRPLVLQKLVDLLMVVALAPFFILSLSATAAVRSLRHVSTDVPLLSDAGSVLGLVWGATSLLVPVAVSFVAFTALYWVVPAKRLRLADIWAGSLLAAVLFEGSKLGFSVYLENFANYDAVFGSLGAVVAFLFWVYVAANDMLLGAEVASEVPRVRRGDYDRPEIDEPEEKPGLQRRILSALRGLVLHEHERPLRSRRPAVTSDEGAAEDPTFPETGEPRPDAQ